MILIFEEFVRAFPKDKDEQRVGVASRLLAMKREQIALSALLQRIKNDFARISVLSGQL